jgi:membrane protease YdiL (CAAX protease family)
MEGFFHLQPLPWFQVWSPAFLSLAFIQPVIEELLFRGVIQGCLLHTAWGQRTLGCLSLANLVTSVAFSSAHMANHTLVWSILILAPSLAFGILRERFDSVYPPITLHVFYNAGYFLLAGGALQDYWMK